MSNVYIPLVVLRAAFVRVAGLACGVAVSAAAAAAERVAGPIAAEVERVVDGDTVKVAARIWIDQRVSVSVRVAGVDAPELFRPACPAEKALAREAKAFVEEMLGDGGASLADIHNGKYAGRVVARVRNSAGDDVGEALLAAGLATTEGAPDPWCDEGSGMAGQRQRDYR
ncbi:MAG: thermonuclease family protein [Parvularculaceae bacterium]|nr:thermonuclease family protein [Parvularculaceae bacterium]